MTDRHRWDSKRKSPLSDPRRRSSQHSEGSYHERGHRDHKYDNRHEKDNKRDRYHDHHSSHHKKHLSDSHYGSSRGDEKHPSNHRSMHRSSYDDKRDSPHHKSSTGHYVNHQKYDSPSSNSYGSSPYSTPPPPPPPAPPPAPPLTPPPGLSSQYTYPNNNFKDRNIVNNNTYRTTDPRMSNLSRSHNLKSEEVKQNFKLLIDPTIKKGHTKIVRYDGVLTGQPSVVPKDPRRIKSKVWTIEVCDLPVPDLKLDKNYVGPMPKDTVRFSGLNDNIDRKFLYELCEAYGDIKEYKVYFDPKTNKHTGTGKVVFDTSTSTDKVVVSLNGRRIMGKEISVWIDTKDPPGHAMWKQLEAECLQKRPKQPDLQQRLQAFNVHISQSPHQATPMTPNISSLHRNHPVAGFNMQPNLYPPGNPAISSLQNKPYNSPGHNYYNKTNSTPPPPPPPLPIQELQQPSSAATPPPPPPSIEYEDISPTGGGDTEGKYRNGKHLPALELLKRQERSKSGSLSPISRTRNMVNRISYSPVSNSDRSNSPTSPAVKDLTPTEKTAGKFSNYESISDGEQPSLVEDISPAISPKMVNNGQSKTAGDDDDAMSLSSISSNEENKVELNVKNLQYQKKDSHLNVQGNSNLLQQNQNINNPVFPYGSNMTPPPQRFFQPRQPGALLPQRPVGMMDYAISTSQQFNQRPYQPRIFQNSNMSGMAPTIPCSSHTSNMIPNGTNNNMSMNMGNIRPPLQSYNARHAEILRNAIYGQGNLPNQSMPPNSNIPSQQYSVTNQNNQGTPQVPGVPKDLPFSFQVKAGCARNLSQELKRILAKDTLKKLVEQSAFCAFENWWEKQKTSKVASDTETVKQEKTETDSSRKLLTDKSTNILSQVIPQPIKDTINTTSALLQNLFGHDKNNENRPPTSASFLNSFRISRKPQTQSSMKVHLISRKRRPWPSMNHTTNKKQRLEESDEEDEDMEEDEKQAEVEEDDQFEQFALRQRQVRRSGSSLYQKIYSDDEEEEEDEDGDRETQSDEEEDECEDEKNDIFSESESDESSDESTSSDSESSESESEEELPETKSEKVDVTKEDEDLVVDDLTTAGISSSQAEHTEDEQKVTFRSMYDERRKRAAVQKAEEKLKVNRPKQKTKPPYKPSRKAKTPLPRITEDSATETADESEEVIEDNRTIDETLPKSNITEKLVKDEEEEEEKDLRKEPTQEELINSLIMLEHNYFIPLPKPDKESERKVLSEKHINNKDSIITDDVFIKAELKHKFFMRNKTEENRIIWYILNHGMDTEDLNYLKDAFETLQQVGSKEVDGLSWEYHPITVTPPQKQKRAKGEKVRVNQSGCARCEGYCKIPMVEKAQYLKSALRQLSVLQQRGDKKDVAGQAGAEHKIKSRENRAMQRRLASSIAQEEFGSLINYNQTLKMRKKALRFAKSSIHNWGLFACEPIVAEEFVCEYVGQMIRAVVAEVRERNYERMGIGSSYLFRLDMDSVIDATKNGCNARFINHSCQPNCYAKVILVEGAKKIVIYSKRDIKLGEEITYDYKFPLEDEKIPCLCGAPGCRGSLN